MRFSPWLPVGIGAVAVHAFRFVGEPGISNISDTALESALQSAGTTRWIWDDALRGRGERIWSVHVTVVNDLPLDKIDHALDGQVAQLTVLSVVQDQESDDEVELCLATFAGQPGDLDGDGPCGLHEDTCRQDLEKLARSHLDCDFDLPVSCQAASRREWQKAMTKVSVRSNQHVFGIASKPAKKGSPEAEEAAAAALDQPFLILAWKHAGTTGEDTAADPIKIRCMTPRPKANTVMNDAVVPEQVDKAQQVLKSPERKAEVEGKGMEDAKQKASLEAEEKFLPKATRDPGRGAGNVTQASLLVAAAAVISAALLAI